MSFANSTTIARQPNRRLILAVAGVALTAPWIALALLPAFPQPQAYHDFADQRSWLGMPHALNVLSNLPFAVIGMLGLALVARGGGVKESASPYALFFAGALLTAFGSAWYHAAPSDSTLVWDRLPIAIAFAGLVAGTLADRAPEWSQRLALAFCGVAIATVLLWSVSGNLLPYIMMQAGFAAAVLVISALVPSRWTHARALYLAIAVYAVALASERYDKLISIWLGGALSGHTIKHLLAAAALVVVLAMLARRRIVQ